MKQGFTFVHIFLSLIVNNASTFLSDDNCLGTLNYRELDASFLREPVRFSKIKKKKTNSHNQFSFMWELKVDSPASSHNQPCQVVLTVRTRSILVHVRTESRFSSQFSQSTMSSGSHGENSVNTALYLYCKGSY
jgi:hypothetical protein